MPPIPTIATGVRLAIACGFHQGELKAMQSNRACCSWLAQPVSPKGLIQSSVDHRFVILHTRYDFPFRIQEEDVSDRAVLRRLLDFDHDPDAAAWHRAAILTIAANEARQRSAAHILKSPQDHPLNSAVDHQGIGQAGIAQRSVDPLGRRRRSGHETNNRSLRASLDGFNSLQTRAMAKNLTVDF